MTPCRNRQHQSQLPRRPLKPCPPARSPRLRQTQLLSPIQSLSNHREHPSGPLRPAVRPRPWRATITLLLNPIRGLRQKRRHQSQPRRSLLRPCPPARQRRPGRIPPLNPIRGAISHCQTTVNLSLARHRQERPPGPSMSWLQWARLRQRRLHPPPRLQKQFPTGLHP